MPVAFRKAAFTSSSAFFIEAAANTVTNFSSAKAAVAPKLRTTKTGMKLRREIMAALRSRWYEPDLSRYTAAREPPFRASLARAQHAMGRELHPSEPAYKVKPKRRSILLAGAAWTGFTLYPGCGAAFHAAPRPGHGECGMSEAIPIDGDSGY